MKMIAEQKADIKKKKETEGKPKPKTKPKGHLGVILVRGLAGVRSDIKGTLFSFRLRKKHACIVVEDTPTHRAAVIKCKDYVAYGEITDATIKSLLEKRGRKNPKRKGFIKKFFLLHPPRGGFERKGIKAPFSKGGALGYRGLEINDLIKRML